MASTKEIKRRIKSVKSTKKITKAMELVAASKMKRAVSQTLSSRLYASYSWEILTSLSGRLEEITHPFFIDPVRSRPRIASATATSGRPASNGAGDKNENNKSLIVLITSNRGLCGGYNSQILKKTIQIIKDKLKQKGDVDIITVGKKGDSSMRKTGQNIIASFTEMPDINIKILDIAPLSSMIVSEFQKGNYQNVYIAYTDFISALNQKPKIRKILPIAKDEFKEVLEENLNENEVKQEINTKEIPYLFEGDTHKLLSTLAEKLVRMQIYQMILESNASEQSSRMVAMKNANEAAGEMIDDLTLVFNKARQANITREISEISAGMASVN